MSIALRSSRVSRARMARRLLVLSAGSFLLGGSSSPVRATTTWIGTTGDWSNPANWDKGVPTPDDPALVTAVISNGGTAQVTNPEGEGTTNLNLGNGTVDNFKTLTLSILRDGLNQPGQYILENGGNATEDQAYVAATYENSNETPADGSFLQLGGRHTVNTSLFIGSNGSAHGRYELDGGTLTLATGTTRTTVLQIGTDDGSNAASTFVQNGGTVTMSGQGSGTLALMGGGTYQLTGGTVRLRSMSFDAGVFTQSGGVTSTGTVMLNGGQFQISGGTLTATATLIIQSGGSFQLSGTGAVSVGTSITNNGPFTQTGGTASAPIISSPALSSFTLTGGTMQDQFGIDVRGDFQFGSAAALTVSGIGNLGFANFTNAGTNGAVTIQPNSLLILPAGVDPATRFASFTNNGMVHNVGSDVVIPSGTTINGTGTIEDPVNVSGTLAATGGAIALAGGITVNSGGVVNTGGGSVAGGITVNSGGVINTGGGSVAGGITVNSGGSVNTGGGTVTVNNLTSHINTGGTVTTGAVVVGAASPGSLAIDGTLTTGSLTIGHGAAGSVTVTSTSSNLGATVGDTSPGFLDLIAGNVGVGGLVVGNNSSGTFIQDGGSVTASTTIANRPGSTGTYQLNGGTFSPSSLFLGQGGAGTLIQSGGTATINVIELGFGNSASGTYILTGGTATIPNLTISTSFIHNKFKQTGGTFTSNSIVTLDENGIFEFGGGSFSAISFHEFGGTTIFDLDPIAPFTPIHPISMFVGGTLEVDLKDGSPLPSQSDSFVLINASSINGSFLNVANGGRISTEGGTFRVNLTASQLILSDFQVPEPTGALLMLGGIGVWLTRRRRIRSA